MQSIRELWFHVESTFTAVHNLVVKARAQQLAIERNQVPSGFRRTMVSGSAAADQQTRDDPRLSAAPGISQAMAGENEPTAVNLVALRQEVRKQLAELKAKVVAVFPSSDVVHSIMFPIVVYFDEFIQIGTRGEANRWELLQSELYHKDNGGEEFYKLLDIKLSQQETPSFVLQIFYLCLSEGFAGKFENSPRDIENCKAQIASRIVIEPVAPLAPPPARDVRIVSLPWQYYVVAFAAVVFTYVLLWWLAVPTLGQVAS